MKIKDLLRDMRTAHGWTTTEIAQKAGMAQSAYSRLENGGRVPKPATLAKIAAAYGFPGNYFTLEIARQQSNNCLRGNNLQGGMTMHLGHDDITDLLHSLTDNDLQYLAERLADKFQPRAQGTYTITELSEKLKLSPETISDRIHKGEFGDVIRDGRRYRVTTAGLQQYIDQHSGQTYHKQEPPQPQYRRKHVNPGKI